MSELRGNTHSNTRRPRDDIPRPTTRYALHDNPHCRSHYQFIGAANLLMSNPRYFSDFHDFDDRYPERKVLYFLHATFLHIVLLAFQHVPTHFLPLLSLPTSFTTSPPTDPLAPPPSPAASLFRRFSTPLAPAPTIFLSLPGSLSRAGSARCTALMCVITNKAPLSRCDGSLLWRGRALLGADLWGARAGDMDGGWAVLER